MQNYLRANATRRVAIAGLTLLAIIIAGMAVVVWRFDAAQAEQRVANEAHVSAANSQELIVVLWHEREVMNEYLLEASPQLMAELTGVRRQFTRAAASVVPHTP